MKVPTAAPHDPGVKGHHKLYLPDKGHVWNSTATIAFNGERLNVLSLRLRTR